MLPVSARLFLKIDAGEILPAVIFHDKACGLFFDEIVVGTVCSENDFLKVRLALEQWINRLFQFHSCNCPPQFRVILQNEEERSCEL